jgi:site-specific DNA recombinase
MRCAIYARYSSDRQNPNSIADQIRKCRLYAESKGWQVLNDSIYTDEALSGTRSDRPAYQQLMKAVKSSSCPFDAILFEDTSRLWRDQEEQAHALKQLRFANIHLLGCDGTDSTSRSANILLGFKGIMNEEYIRELTDRTRRGLQGAALEGTHTGGRCFGYQNVTLPHNGNSKRRPSKLVVDPEQAEIVKRIFQMYADGFSLKAIAKKFNAEKVISPRPATGRLQQSWCPSSIRPILHNERYTGVVVFGKTRKHVKATDNKRVARPGPEADKIRKDFPDQRIVSESLWNRVQARMVQIKGVYGERGRRGGLAKAGNAAGNPYLFSGLLKCGECGGNLVIVSGRGKNHGEPHYGCLMNFNRNTCSNSVRIRKDILEGQLLSKLQNEVLREEVIDYALSRFEEELTKAVRSASGQMSRLEQKKRKLEKELQNLSKAIASGLDSATVRSEIVDREREIQNINSQVLAAKPESVRTKINDARKFVESSLKDIRKVLGSDPMTAKTTLSRHMPSIVLKHEVKPDGRKIYHVTSQWELLSGEATLLECAGGQS